MTHLHPRESSNWRRRAQRSRGHRHRTQSLPTAVILPSSPAGILQSKELRNAMSKVRGREIAEVQLLSLHRILLLFKEKSISLLNLWGLALKPSRHKEKTSNHRVSKHPPRRNAERDPGTSWNREEKLLKTTLRNAIRAKEWF